MEVSKTNIKSLVGRITKMGLQSVGMGSNGFERKVLSQNGKVVYGGYYDREGQPVRDHQVYRENDTICVFFDDQSNVIGLEVI